MQVRTHHSLTFIRSVADDTTTTTSATTSTTKAVPTTTSVGAAAHISVVPVVEQQLQRPAQYTIEGTTTEDTDVDTLAQNKVYIYVWYISDIYLIYIWYIFDIYLSVIYVRTLCVV